MPKWRPFRHDSISAVVPVERRLRIPDRSFFLFGPRGVGKSHLIRGALPGAVTFDLLNTGLQLRLTRSPDLLEASVGSQPRGTWVWIDEVQKVPALLDEVHRLIESRGWRFALSGSSARKLLRQGANLLAGRASTRRLEAFSAVELSDHFDLSHALQWGTLPLVVGEPDAARDVLDAYVHTYIREEVKEEGLVRRLEPFLRFLDVAGALNGQIVNVENIAREAQVPRKSAVQYFSVLEDTLMTHPLPAFQPQLKVREVSHPKYYWFDPGVARAAAGLLDGPVDSNWLGQALETLVFHELRVYNHTSNRNKAFSYYRTRAGLEVDFVIELERRTASRKAKICCIEVKSSRKWDRRWEAAMRGLADSGKLRLDRMIGIYLGDATYHFDGVDVLPLPRFLNELFAGHVY
jgi:predicted AAA+ superfamily ATPase